jgi:predicted RNase H-like nuclease (RuvC/YqgF family)
MSKNLQGYLLFAILGMFVAYMIWGQPEINVDIQKYELRIQLLERKIDSISDKNRILELKADSLNIKIADYSDEIKKLNSKIYVIKRETKKKLDAIDTFGNSELQKFFTDRYSQGLDKDSIN